MTKKFEIGKTYFCRSACDHECIFSYTILSRTAKMVTIRSKHGEESRRKITVINDTEKFYPEGVYSMCPVISADSEMKEDNTMTTETTSILIDADYIDNLLKEELAPKKTTRKATKKAATSKKSPKKSTNKARAAEICHQLCFCFEVKAESVYFTNVNDMKALRESYKALAAIHHPDRGGDTATMAAINAEYDQKVKELAKDEKPAKHTTTLADGMSDEEIARAIAEEFKATLDALMSLDLDGCKVELIGSWLWVSGNTKPIKDQLKALKFRWCPKKEGQPWIWHDSYTFYISSKGRMNKEDIEDKYGCETLKSA